jgi:O-antigen/teichoic acid export membrane protein
MASLLRNVAVNMLGFLAGKAAAAVTGILLLRALQPEAAGIYVAALGFAALFQSFADLGLGACLTRLASSQPKKAAQWYSLGLAAQLLQATAAGLGMALFLKLGGAHGVEPGLVALAFGISACASLATPAAAVLQGLERFGLLGTLTTTASLLNAAGLGALLLAGAASPRAALAASLLAAGIGLFLWLGGARRAGLRLKAVSLGGVLTLWRQSLPFALVSVSNQFYIRVDLALLAWMLGTGPLGFYGAAVKLVDLMVPVLGALNGPLYARLAGLHGVKGSGKKAALARAWGNLNRALRFMALLCLPIGVGGSLLAAPLVAWLFGGSFTPAGPALAWLVWVPALIGIHGCLLHGLNAVGATLRLAQIFGLNLLLNIGLNLWLIPHYGITASAAVSVLCEGVNLLAAWILARRLGLAPSLKGAFWPALPAALLMGVLLSRLPAWPAPALVAAGMAGYGAALLALGFLGADERAQLRRVMGKA